MSETTPRRILVTGATGGLGSAIARLLDGLGHRTVLQGRDGKALDALSQGLSHAKTLTLDLQDLCSVEKAIERAMAMLGGGLDGLINNAGTIDPIGFLVDNDAKAWARAIEVNLTAPALLMRGALPALSESRGRLVNVSSGAAFKPMAGWSAYCASKAGLLHLTAVAALEAPEVACFSLRPGVIDTPMQAVIRESRGMRESDHQRFLNLRAEGALEPPEVPARAAVWLALNGPAERTGQLIEYTDPQVLAGVRELFESKPG